MPHIVGIFDTGPLANEAIADLLSRGLTKDEISIIMSDKTREHFSAATKDTADRAVVDSAIGAGIGGILGALLSSMTVVGSLFVPGVQLLVIGPVISALAGLGTGAAIGGLAGGLSAYGISAVEASRYADEIRAGKAVIIAHARNDAQAQLARAVLMTKGAEIRAA